MDKALHPRPGIRAAIDFVATDWEQSITLADLARAASMPPNTLTRRFNHTFGITPMRWLWAFRTIVAAEFIHLSPGWPLTEIALRCGFRSAAHFSRRFQDVFDISPSHFRSMVLGRSPEAKPRRCLQPPYEGFYDDHEDAVMTVLSRFRDELQGVPWTPTGDPALARIP